MSCNPEMEVIYIPEMKVTAHFQSGATPAFWDAQWEAMDHGLLTQCTTDPFFSPVVTKYLPTGATILEAGCGHGQIVHSLHAQGYRAIGVDYAEKTLTRVREAAPYLDLRVGDVRELPIEDDSTDGYVSGGVIEHFWDGYSQILHEIRRTLRVGGYAFVTFPFMSPLRQMKAAMGVYKRSSYSELTPRREEFYHFSLHWPDVVRDFAQLGFYLQEFDYLDGIKGAKDEMAWVQPFLQPIYDGQNPELRAGLDEVLSPIASHIVRIVLRKLH